MKAPLALPLFVSLLALAGCAAVGPNYVRPDVPAPAGWHAPLPGDAAAKPPDPAELARWWATLGDPELTSLVERAAAGSLDLRQARARVRAARARRVEAKTAAFPTLDATGSASRSGSSGGAQGASSVRSLFSAGFDAGWEVDLFGGVRRSVEAADADLGAEEEALGDVLVSLTAETALNYVEVRTGQARLREAEANLASQEETLRLVDARRRAGFTDALAPEQARSNLESTRAQLGSLRIGIEEAKNRLAVLLGLAPGTLDAELSQSAPIPLAPAAVAVGVPAQTLRRRPDVRKAERELAAQTARIGVATAELYPKLSLSGSLGLDAATAGSLVGDPTRLWSLGPRLSWRLFDRSAVRANVEVQSAGQEGALAAYEASVLGALEQVENALSAFAEEGKRLAALKEAARAAGSAADLAERKYEAGVADFLTVLDAQRSRRSAEDQLAQSEGALTSNLIRLYKALGGGWTPLAEAGKDAP